jgi:sugar phosphate isomerase/epimerase
MPVGWGGIPLREILDTFVHQYEGMLMMELRSRYFQHTDESTRNLKGILEALRDSRGRELPAALRRVS